MNGLRPRPRRGRARRRRAFIVSTFAGARNGRPQSTVAFLCFRPAAIERKKLARFTGRTAKTSARQRLRKRRRSDSVLRRDQWRREITARRSETSRAGRFDRETTRVEIRTGSSERCVDQTEKLERTGIRHWRLNPARRSQKTFRRDPRRLLRVRRRKIGKENRQSSAVRRESRDRVQ